MKNKGTLTQPTPENSRAIPGALFHFLAKGEDTGNRHALLKIDVQPGAEPPEHTHAHEDEAYYILDGKITFKVGDEFFEASTGDYVFLPKEVSHTFQVKSEVARVLMWISPAGLDQWFWDNSAPAPDMKPLPALQGPPPEDIIYHNVTTLKEYGVEMV
ncbi:cupin domain-containing protein [Telluribacter sp. SYSU D00476]|uniref:cupin domain-containing protein n=1 Tax=Telluribacter sp. SYSU D00476 TaxID=2811430 RepID=UPI001FF5A17E|nr:cupin domain-containing protein [Telluribacter sp. SYSU D00476]